MDVSSVNLYFGEVYEWRFASKPGVNEKEFEAKTTNGYGPVDLRLQSIQKDVPRLDDFALFRQITRVVERTATPVN